MATATAGSLHEPVRHRDARNFAESESVYSRILPDNPHAPYFLGVLALQTERPRDGMELLRRALVERPGPPVILNALALALDSSGDLAGAEPAGRRPAGDS